MAGFAVMTQGVDLDHRVSGNEAAQVGDREATLPIVDQLAGDRFDHRVDEDPAWGLLLVARGTHGQVDEESGGDEQSRQDQAVIVLLVVVLLVVNVVKILI